MEVISCGAYLLCKVPRRRTHGLVGFLLYAMTGPNVIQLISLQSEAAVSVSVFGWTGVKDCIASKAHGSVLSMSIASLDRGSQNAR
jgi:hypothetical protein